MENILAIVTLALLTIGIIIMVLVLVSMRKELAKTGKEIREYQAALAETRGAVKDSERQLNDIRREMAQNLDANKESLNKAMAENSFRLTQSLEANKAGIEKSISDNNFQMEQRVARLEESVKERLTAIQKDNSEQLDKMRQTVDEKLEKTLNERLSQSFDTVRKSLDSVMAGLGEMKEVGAGVTDLKKVLSNVKTRGILGEYQLGAILGEILTKDQYEENAEVVPGSGKRVEFAIKMPGDGETPVYLPIDSKFPGDTYAKLLEAYDTGEKDIIDAARKNLVSRLKEEAKDINEKYIKAPYTADFGVMFLPFEGLYSEAVNLGMMEELQKNYKVIVAGPSTMAAFLNSIQMGFKTLAIQKNAGEAWTVLGKVKSEFSTFSGLLDKVHKKLSEADKVVDELSGRRTRAIERSLRSVEALPSGNAGALPADAADDLAESEDLGSTEGI